MSRSPNEIYFRLRQEFTNLRLWAAAPNLPVAAISNIQAPCSGLPNPAGVSNRLANTTFAAECIAIAEEILAHRSPMLGVTLSTGPEIRWRRDYHSGIESPPIYFRRIPYLDTTKAGDHKVIWELNRHQHLVLLAQAHLFSGRRDFLDEIVRELESWFEQNPFQRGINWSSALEVAFRALSWIWIYHLVGNCFDQAFRVRFLTGLYRHGRHLDCNLSFYFSPNTHLLGEAVALHAMGALFPQFPRAQRWRGMGARVVRNELDRQVHRDGSHFEQSTYYHVYALDMFLFHAILLGMDDALREPVQRMADFLQAIVGRSGHLPFLGDDDGGRFFHPYGARGQFALASLATCGQIFDRQDWIRDPRYLLEQAAWWIDSPAKPATARTFSEKSLRFADGGLVVMAADEVQVIVDAGPFGPGSGGHSHADTLSVVLRCKDDQILIDPGTYTYVADPVWRDRFRGTAAHNTLRLDGLDQAVPRGPFAWKSPPEVRLTAWTTCAQFDRLQAVCTYSGVSHQRDVVFSKSDLLLVVVDQVRRDGAQDDDAEKEHLLEQFWHFGGELLPISPSSFQAGASALAVFEPSSNIRSFEGGDYGWISPCFGKKVAGSVVCVERVTTLPASMVAGFDLSSKRKPLTFTLHADGEGIDCVSAGGSAFSLRWTARGVERSITS